MPEATSIAADYATLQNFFKKKEDDFYDDTSCQNDNELVTIYYDPRQGLSRYLASNPDVLTLNLDNTPGLPDDFQHELVFRNTLVTTRPLVEGIHGMLLLKTSDLPFYIEDYETNHTFKNYTTAHTSFSELPTIPITYRNSVTVENYLDRYPDIMKFIQESSASLIKCFGPSVSLVLEIMEYHYDTYYEELVGWIQSTEDVQTGLEMLDQFEDECLQDQINKVGNKFNFNIEFI